MFDLRILWLTDLKIPLDKALKSRLTALGYQALMVEEKTLADELLAHGIPTVLKLSIFPKGPVPFCDYIFWDSSCKEADFAKDPIFDDMTSVEVIAEKIATLESLISEKTKLIVRIASQNSQDDAAFLTYLADQVGKNTYLCFNAVAGFFYEDHQAPHPAWDVMASLVEPSATPFIPIVNIGGIGQGEGLFPCLSLDLVEKFFCRLNRDPFCGFIAVARHLPDTGVWLDCSLWVAGQSGFVEKSSQDLVKEWFKIYRQGMDYHVCEPYFLQVRQIVLELSRLKNETHLSHERWKAKADSLSLQVSDLLLEVSEIPDSTSHVHLSHYMRYFGRDVRKILLWLFQQHKIQPTSLLAGNDCRESFWTKMQSSHGSFGGGKITLLDKPDSLSEDPWMKKILEENRF